MRVGAALLVAGLVGAGCSSSASVPSRSVSSPPASPPSTAGVEATTAPWHLGAPVSRAVVCADGASLLVLGGLATGDTSTTAVWKVDPARGSVERSGSLARAVHDAAGACTGSGALVLGGGSFSTVSSVQQWSPGGTSLVGQLPQPRSDLGAASLGGRIYVVGGFDGTQMTPAILATSNGTGFAVVGELPVPVRYPAVAAAGGAVWVIGGQLGTAESSTVGGQTDAIQRFDPATGQTAVVGHLPVLLGHATALYLGGELVVAGGRTGSVASDRIWVVDTRTGGVRSAGQLPTALSDAGAGVVDGAGWLVGGEVSGPAAPLDSVVELRRD